jgi:preprotein translocase subunit SecD
MAVREGAAGGNSIVRSRDATFLVFVLIIVGLALWIVFAPNNQWFGRDVSTRLGLDLQGGTQVLLRADSPNVSSDIMQTAAGVIERRVNGLGVSEAVVQLSGSDRIIVELPGVRNSTQAIETLRGTGQLEFIDSQGQYLASGTLVRTSGNPDPQVAPPPGATQPVSPTTATGPVYNSITTGADLDTRAVSLRVGGSQNLSNPFAVAFAFTGQSAQQLASFSAANVGQPMCIVLDNVVFSCPQLQAALVGGSGEITTSTREDAERIFNQLKYGALPIGLTVESSRTVSASLGQNSVDASIAAAVIGLSAVMLFLTLYYRLPGLIATIVLLIYAVLIFAIYRLLPVTLTLAGIAGFILSVGVMVDANVLISGRLKEELRHGRSLRSAVETGFEQAWSAILDSNVAMLITSLILFLFGSSFGVGIIRGFAVTLGLGTLVSLAVVWMVTLPLLRAVAAVPGLGRPWLFDLGRAPGLEREAT